MQNIFCPAISHIGHRFRCPARIQPWIMVAWNAEVSKYYYENYSIINCSNTRDLVYEEGRLTTIFHTK